MSRAVLLAVVAILQVAAFIATYGTFFARVPRSVQIVWGSNLACNFVLIGVVLYDGWYFETKRRDERDNRS